MKEHRFFLVFLTFFLLMNVCALTNAQTQIVTQKWVRRFNGSANEPDEPGALAIDDNGNIYVTGKGAFVGTGNDYLTIRYNPDGTEAWVTRLDFGPSNDIAGNDNANDIVVDNAGNVYVTGFGNDAYATVKYSSATGDTIWTRKHRSESGTLATATDIALDDGGNIYVTGEFNRSANPATSDISTIKYNSDGDTLWVTTFDRGNVDLPHDITIDVAGNVYIAGRSDTSGTGADFITIKYNTDGEEKWSRRYAAASSNVAEAVAVDNSGNVYVTGGGFGSGFGSDYITIRYDSMGVEKWVKFYDGGGVQDAASDLVTDNVNVYVTGTSGGSYATIKYFADGDTAWVRRFPASGGRSGPQANAIAIDNFNNVYVTGRRGTPASLDYLTLKYSTEGIFQWSQEYNGPGNNTDEAVDTGVDNQGNVYVTGFSFGDTTNFDYATIKYGQRGGGGPCWETDTFDNLSPGSLNGQNGWTTVSDSLDAVVVANSFGGGQVLELDAPPGRHIIMGKNVPVQSDGIHTLELRVLADPVDTSMAKIEVKTSGNPNWDKKFQLYFGTQMRLNYGPTQPEAILFLTDVEALRWYDVKAGIDLATNLVDVFVDGELKLDDIAVGPGPIEMLSISGWDSTGFVLFDDIFGCRSGPITYVTPPGARRLPEDFALLPNYPNPFNPSTTIQFKLPAASDISLIIYDALGREVKELVSGRYGSGIYTVSWDGRTEQGLTVGSGVYFLALRAGVFLAVRKMTVVK